VVLIAGLGAGSPFGQTLEDRTVDARFAIVPRQPPDARLLIVALDEETLVRDSRPLVDWDTDFAQMINRILSGGALAVAIDLLLPATWSLSPEFGRAVATHVDHLALAKLSTHSGTVVGPECVGSLAAYAIGPQRLASAFGFVNLDTDRDGRVRRPRIVYLDRDGREQPSFAARAVLAASSNSSRIPLENHRMWIDYSTQPRDIPTLSWKDVAGRLRDSPSLFRDRLVIIGAEYVAANDEHPIPASSSQELVSGAVIQALVANTILKGLPVRDGSLPRCLLAIAAACFGIFLLALRFPHRPALVFFAAATSLCVYMLVAFAIFRWSRMLLALTGPELAIIMSWLAAWVLKSRLKPYPGEPRVG
jgi:CHASE2 domain-containing sensor protein